MIGDASATFLSFRYLGIPKHASQNHSDQSNMDYSVTANVFSLPLYFQCHTVRKFFHSHLVQSTLPSSSGVPRASEFSSILLMSSSVGRRRYAGKHYAITAALIRLTVLRAVFSEIST